MPFTNPAKQENLLPLPEEPNPYRGGDDPAKEDRRECDSEDDQERRLVDSSLL